MNRFNTEDLPVTDRVKKLIADLFEKLPEIEADRAVLITESYKRTENMPIIKRRALAFKNILENIPITIRDMELVVGSATKAPRGCQVFPEYSYEWLEAEFDTVETREADPFYISEETKAKLREVYPYWKGKTTSDLAEAYMAPETKLAIEHNIFTPGNYFYNGIGHVTVDYGKIIKIGYKGLMNEAAAALSKLNVYDADYSERKEFLEAVIISCDAAITYTKRYAELARKEAKSCGDSARAAELLQIAQNCQSAPENGAKTFYEACQCFWFIQMLLQVESSGHSISPGRFDQYMYPYYKADIEAGRITRPFAQELVDCIWVKLNDLNKVRDAASAEGFAGYSLFQNLIAGGQTREGLDATNDMSFICIQASMHTLLPAPSFSVRVWNGTPNEFMIKAAELTRTGIGLPAYYNDEVIIPALMSRGIPLEDALDYNIIGCVEPQTPHKTDGWHDAAFFNMCRPLEMVFSNGVDKGVQIGPMTGNVEDFKTFDEFLNAYKTQMQYFIQLMVNADNAIDTAHAKRCPLPFQSSMVEDCIGRGKSMQEGGALYNFTGPQGFGIANMTDALYAVKTLVYDKKLVTITEYKDALEHNFGKGMTKKAAAAATAEVVERLRAGGKTADEKTVGNIARMFLENSVCTPEQKAKYDKLLDLIENVEKYGNDLEDIDMFAREVAYIYTKELPKYKNPRGGIFQAGLYPVSANVPLGEQTGATPDGRLANTPVADGVGPFSGKDQFGPTAAANSVSMLDHAMASNGTLYNQKFHPSALAGQSGLQSFADYIRAFFDKKGMHMQFNVVSRDTLIDAQKHPEKYKSLVVRVAGYSALFTTLSRSLQDDIINRTEQTFGM
ncbi:MAG: glycyl radical protein [Clostridiales bacterium]|nr:glycyl radical protein [Clostridiales bacterium]